MTLKKYRILDILILTVIAVIADVLSNLASGWISAQWIFPMYIAPSIVFIVFIYIRWNYAGVFSHLGLLGVQMLLLRNELFSNAWLLLAFIIGYLSIAWVLLLRPKQSNILRSRKKTLLIYFLATLGIMITLESIVLMITPIDGTVVDLLFRHLVNFIMLLIVFMIAQRQKDFLTDMKSYLIKVEKERNEKEKNYDG